MINYQFEKYARRNRHKALFFTIAFHTLLLGAAFWGNDVPVEEYLPEVVQEWLGMETDEQEAVARIPGEEVIRP